MLRKSVLIVSLNIDRGTFKIKRRQLDWTGLTLLMFDIYDALQSS